MQDGNAPTPSVASNEAPASSGAVGPFLWFGRRLRALPLQDRLALGLMVAYLTSMGLAFGIRPEQLPFCALLAFLALYNDRTRWVFEGLLPFQAFAVSYDLLHFTQPLIERFRLPVHVAEPYLVDRALFGIVSGGRVLTPNEVLGLHPSTPLDLVSGLAYALFLWWALGLAIALSLRSDDRHRRLLRRYGWAFFGMSLAAFATYYLYPAAPPWYVQQYGFGPVHYEAQPNIAGAARFDALVGFSYFATMYARSANVFGAIPSLHVAFPLLAFLFGRELRLRWLDAASGSLVLVVSFSALYLQHHYLIDVLLGAAYALAAYGASCFWKTRNRL